MTTQDRQAADAAEANVLTEVLEDTAVPKQGAIELERLEQERLQKERLNAAKQERRAAAVATSISKFINEFQTASKPSSAQSAATGARSGKGGKAASAGSAQGQKSKGKAASSTTGSKKKPTVTPKAQAWATFLVELDEKVHKTKKCGLENFYQAIARLEPQQQQVFASILASTTKKELPTANMTEPVLAIKEALYAATAAYSYTDNKVPDASSRLAQAFKDSGTSAREALDAGFRVGQLSRAGFSSRELVESCTDLREIRQGGISVAEVMRANVHDLEGVAGARLLKAAGYTATAIHEAAAGAIGAWDLRLAGYSHPANAATAARANNMSMPGSAASSSSGRVPPPPFQAQPLALALPRKASMQAGSGTCSGDTRGSRGGSGVAELIGELHYSAPGLGLMQPGTAVDYFRHGIKPVMHMEAERDMPAALLGTRKQDQQAVPVAEPSARQRGGKAANAVARRSIEGEPSATSLTDSPIALRRRGRAAVPAHGAPQAAAASKEGAAGAAALPAGHSAAVNRHATHPSRFVSDSMASIPDDEEYDK